MCVSIRVCLSNCLIMCVCVCFRWVCNGQSFWQTSALEINLSVLCNLCKCDRWDLPVSCTSKYNTLKLKKKEKWDLVSIQFLGVKSLNQSEYFIYSYPHSNMRKCFVGILSVCRRDRGRTAVWDKCRNVDKWKAEVFTKFTNNNHLMNMNGKCHAVPQRGCLLLYDSSQ